MSLVWWYAAVGVAASAVAALWPLSPALSSSEVLQARLVSAVITGVVCAAIGLSRGVRSAVWMAVSIVSAAAGIAALLAHFDATASCLVEYNSRSVVIGREYRVDATDYVRSNRGLSASDLLLDVGGDPDRIWTAASISSCRFWVSWGGLLAVPLFAACVGALIARRGYRFAAAPARVAPVRSPGTVRAPIYDAFLSYRHTEPDKTHVCEILDVLESRGLRVAVDFRDFGPNEHFLSEMERCIKESRFVLCVVTSQYVHSDHCSEEAIISKTLDMADRKKRLVPLIFERVELPVWLHGLVGIDFSQSATVDPIERLLALMTTKPATARS